MIILLALPCIVERHERGIEISRSYIPEDLLRIDAFSWMLAHVYSARNGVDYCEFVHTSQNFENGRKRREQEEVKKDTENKLQNPIESSNTKPSTLHLDI